MKVMVSTGLHAGLIQHGSIGGGLSKEMRHGHFHGHGRTMHNLSSSSSSLRKKSDLSLVSKFRCGVIRNLLATLQEIFLGTKLFVLFPAVPLAIAAKSYGFGRAWVFALSLLGLTPLAERVSFLTEQIAFYTGPTVGGLLNATCGNATELIIALFALHKGKINLVKFSLIGSILSNLLLVLGTSLFCGGIANLHKEQSFDRKQVDVNTSLLILGALCHMLPLLFRFAVHSSEHDVSTAPTLLLSRVCSIVMLAAYIAYLLFQLKTHRQLFESQEEDEDDDVVSEVEPIMGFPSALALLVGMTIVIAILSEYVVGTIEAASDSWGISMSFISIILLPIVGNAAEHAGAIIFALKNKLAASDSWGISMSFISIILLPIVGNAAEHAGAIIFALKNKLNITLGVSLGSATQISMFVVPLSVIVAWIMGIQMDLDFKLLETGALVVSILLSSFALQDGSSHYLKGFVLFLAYVVIGACFFIFRTPTDQLNSANVNAISHIVET